MGAPYIYDISRLRVKLIPLHSSLAGTVLVEGAESIRIWTVAVNILNKQLRTGEKFSPSLWGWAVGLIK